MHFNLHVLMTNFSIGYSKDIKIVMQEGYISWSSIYYFFIFCVTFLYCSNCLRATNVHDITIQIRNQVRDRWVDFSKYIILW